MHNCSKDKLSDDEINIKEWPIGANIDEWKQKKVYRGDH